MAEFTLNPKLAEDSIFIKDLPLSQLRLMNDSNYPWFILVPRKNNICELFELSISEQQELMSEITEISHIVKKQFKSDKINVANLGNIVSQLHIHIIARFRSDPTWPNPIWGKNTAKKYDEKQIKYIKNLF